MTPQIPDTSYIERAIKLEIENRFEEIKKDLDREKDRIVAGILLHVMKSIDVQRMGETIRFEVRIK